MSGERLVLVVDDDPVVASGLARSFERARFRAHVANELEQAVKVAAELRPELAVVDLWLSDGTGFDLVARLRANDPKLRIVVISGSVTIEDAVQATRAGADRVLMKPVSVAHIVDKNAPVPDSGESPPTLARVEWEYMSRTLADAHGNISEAARRLGIRRQSLQRKLKRHAPPR